MLKKLNPYTPFGKWTDERPIFLMGDFNCHPGSDPHKVLVGEGDSSNTTLFTDTNINGDPKEIDWILYQGNVEVLTYEEIDYNQKGIYPSDHKPIFVEFSIK